MSNGYLTLGHAAHEESKSSSMSASAAYQSGPVSRYGSLSY